jgi:aspartate/methionine/tyrosine aminotransferase
MISKKSLDIPPFLVMDVLEKAYEMERAGQRVIHLEVGEPDFETPQCIKDACIKAIREGKTKYTHSLGLFELREALAGYYTTKYGKELSPHQIIITTGSSPALFLLFSTILENSAGMVGTEVNTIKAKSKNTPLFIHTTEQENFWFTLIAKNSQLSGFSS